MELKVLVLVAGIYLGFFCLVVAIVIVSLILRHRQRMAMIEKGIAPGTKPPQSHLKRGLLLSFIGGGLIVCFVILQARGPFQVLAPLGGIILLAIGLAQLTYYGLTRPKAAPPGEKESAESQGREEDQKSGS